VLSKASAKLVEQIHTLGVKNQWDGARKLIQGGLRGNEFPDRLRHTFKTLDGHARRLNSLENIKQAIGQSWKRPPDVPRLRQDLAGLLDGTGDAALATRTQRFLALKAAWEGHPKAALELLPPRATGEDNPTLLRDLKALVMGEGKAAPQAAGKAAGEMSGSRIPTDIPIPDPGPGGVRPAVKGSARAGLPPLDKAKASSKKPFRELKEVIREQIEIQRQGMEVHLHILQDYSRKARELSRDKDKTTSQAQPAPTVKKLLGRDLTPAERVLMTQMHRRGKTPAQMAAILRRLKPTAP
jgi:hypothetical protein